MTVRVRPYRRGGWEVDISVLTADGRRHRERRKMDLPSKSAATRWGEARQRELTLHGPRKPRKEVPTLTAFIPRFVEGYVKANRFKPSGVAIKQVNLRTYVEPLLGRKRLDDILNEDVQRLKARYAHLAPSSVNGMLTVLRTLLRVAEEWGVIDEAPCTIRYLPIPPRVAAFYDFETFERLVSAARDRVTLLILLLGGEAGLRAGEFRALEWRDLDFQAGRLSVHRADWKGHVTDPKGFRPRHIPLTKRLAETLQAHRHLLGPLVLCRDDGSAMPHISVVERVHRAARRANVEAHGVHILRHTFCSHLAMHGAPARAIQELAGHANLATTQRYMHLSPAAIEGAIRLLDGPRRGDMLETATGEA